jgi:hypothetical protein
MAKTISGGGATSNKNVSPKVRAGSPNVRKINQNQVGGIGAQRVFADGGTGPKLAMGETRDFVPMGNAVALNVGKGGPGTGRDVLDCGTQGVHSGGPRSANAAAPKASPDGGAPKSRGTT